MNNKKVIASVILCILAVISLIYGITATPRRTKTVSILASKEISAASSFDYNVLIKRRAKRTEYMTWGRNPFAQEIHSATEATRGPALNGIMWDEKRPLAIIDNEAVGVGGKVGEYTVVGINKDSVILNDGTGDRELRLVQ